MGIAVSPIRYRRRTGIGSLDMGKVGQRTLSNVLRDEGSRRTECRWRSVSLARMEQ